MRIVQEKLDNENYLEFCISAREFDLLKNYMIISKKIYLEGEITNVGIKLRLDIEDEDDDDEVEF